MSCCPSFLLPLLKQHAGSTRQLSQIFAQAITTALTHSTLTWNFIIRAYAKSPTPIKAIIVYNHFVKSTSLIPDNHTFPALLSACSFLHSLSKGREIHGCVSKIGLASDMYIQNALIHMYGVMAELNDARRLFDLMGVKALTTWNSMLQAHIGHPASHVEVMILFKEMVGGGIGVDDITLLIIMSTCCQLGTVEYGKMIHVFVLKMGFIGKVKLENSLLKLYAKVLDMDSASRLFAEMGSGDVVSNTIMVNGYVDSGLMDMAFEVFERVVEKDLVIWNSMIGGYMKTGQPKKALELFQIMEMDGVASDETTVVVALSACTSLSNFTFGKFMHQFIYRRNIKIDVFVETALIDMYIKCGSMKEAVQIFFKMKNRDVFTWTTVIMGLGTHGYGKDAVRLFLQMHTDGVEPNEATFVAVLTACSRSGLINEGRYCINQMIEVGQVVPKIEHFGCVIDLLSRAGLVLEAKELIKIAIPIESRTTAYKALLSACVSHGDLGTGEVVAKELMKMGSDGHGVYVLLSNFYAVAGKWDAVEEIRRTMKVLDIRKDVGMSFIDMKADL
ncbi:pentatricopeptide repeat-containing protein At2g29760, chloroplastic-like [Aristolochia californica]|uniref:pentatricopeptide repeat-containing protein At2g29760, chloroplastic-like n=1 Tax=Aristolochia californica TaxID=171875 RepID=UPI0035E37299